MLRRLGVPLFDADAEVHRLLGPGGKAVAAVEALFPGVRDDDRRDRPAPCSASACLAIRRRCGGSKRSCIRWCAQAETRFVAAGAGAARKPRRARHPAPVRDRRDRTACDYVLVVSAPARVQRERVMRRPGMTEQPLREHFAGADAGSRKAPARRFRRADRARTRLDVPPVAAGRRRAAAWANARGVLHGQRERRCGKS